MADKSDLPPPSSVPIVSNETHAVMPTPFSEGDDDNDKKPAAVEDGGVVTDIALDDIIAPKTRNTFPKKKGKHPSLLGRRNVRM